MSVKNGYKVMYWNGVKWEDKMMIEKSGFYAVVKGTIPLMKKTLSAINYPNPFNPETNIRIILPYAGKMTLKIYDTKGRLVRILVNNNYYSPGLYVIHWDGKNKNGKEVASGIYYALVLQNGKKIVHKMVLLK